MSTHEVAPATRTVPARATWPRWAGIAILAMVAAGCTILDPNPDALVSKPGDTATGPETGQQIYLRSCSGCHGVSGVPADTSVKTLRGWPGDFAKFDSTLTIGPGAMPVFPELDSDSRMKVFEFVKKFPPI